MLAQAVIAAYEKPESDGIHRGQLTVTGVSPCPYATYLNYYHLDDQEFDAASRLRMKNGYWQEMEVLEDLRKAGFTLRYTGNSQITVHVGKASITGRPDGLVVVDNREDMLEIKAMSLNVYTDLKQKGIDAFPSYKCQAQLYLASEELKDRVGGCWFYVKHKDSCRPYDIFLERDEAYARPIVEAVDEIVLGKVEVSRPTEAIPLCSNCRHRLFCWKTELLDTSGIKTTSLPEAVGKWIEGRIYLDWGKTLDEEARVVLKEYLGSDDVLYAEGENSLLQVKRIIQRRSGISEAKFVERYGAAALADVMEEKVFEQVRVTQKE